jgi:hypothetical protein
LPATRRSSTPSARCLSAVSSKKIWIKRPAPDPLGPDLILPVDWCAITQGDSTATNYQLLPGDRVYVKADPLISFDNFVAKVLAPVERIFGVTLLGSETVRSLEGETGTVFGF